GPPPGEGSMRPSLLDPPRDSHSPAALCPVRPGMAVLDRRGEKVGAACALYRDLVAEVEGRPGRLYAGVRTGVLGLGGASSVPLAAFRAVGDACAVLACARADLDELGYDRPPPGVA